MKALTSQKTLRIVWCMIGAGLLAGGLLFGLSNVAIAGGVVGNGTPQSCTEAAFDAAWAGGGVISFNCGSAPYTLILTSEKVVAGQTTLDGGGLITLVPITDVRPIWVPSGASLTTVDITFYGGAVISEGRDGGGIYNDGTLHLIRTTMVRQTTFNGCSGCGGGIGGAVYNLGRMEADDSLFQWNVASYGGAIYSTGSLHIRNSRFDTNLGFASGSFGSNYGSGGAIYTSGVLTVENTFFLNNLAPYGGHCCETNPPAGGSIKNLGEALISGASFVGGEAGAGAAIANMEGATLTVQDSLFRQNEGVSPNQSDGVGVGAAIWNKGTLTVADSLFVGNVADFNGGAIHNSGTMTVTRSQFRANRTNPPNPEDLISPKASGGGALYLAGPSKIDNSVFIQNASPLLYGSAIQIDEGDVTLNHVTFARNRLGPGISANGPVTLSVANAIFYEHRVAISTSLQVNANIDGVLWRSNNWDTVGDGTVIVQHAITGDPAFSFDGMHLGVSSAAIDAGVPSSLTVDIDGQPRLSGVAPDLGADEAHAAAFPFPSTGSVQVARAGNDLCLDVWGASQANDAAVTQWFCAAQPNQQWQLQQVGDAFLVRSANSDLCLDVRGRSMEEDGVVIQWQCKESDNQLWRLQPAGNGYLLVAAHSNMCLTIPWQGIDVAGVQAVQATCTGTTNQQFYVIDLNFIPRIELLK